MISLIDDEQKLFNDKQFYAMCDCNMSLPVKLGEANLLNSFVYDRKYGLFYVPNGFHQTAMSLLLAFHYGLDTGIHVAKKLNINFSDGTADFYLRNIKGTAFRSSVGKKIMIGSFGNLNKSELLILNDCICIFD